MVYRKASFVQRYENGANVSKVSGEIWSLLVRCDTGAVFVVSASCSRQTSTGDELARNYTWFDRIFAASF